jgi:hypothetical protein
MRKDSSRKTPKVGWFVGVDTDKNSEVHTKKQFLTNTAKDVHNKFINRQVTRAAELGDLSRLFEVISTYAVDMNGINLATAFHRVAKLSQGPDISSMMLQAIKNDPCFATLLTDITRHVSQHRHLARRRGAPSGAVLSGADVASGEMPVQCLSIVAWSCATLRIWNEELFAQIAAIVEPNLGELKSYELSNLLWAYAKLHMTATDLFNAAAERLLNRGEGEFKVQCLSTIAWCFATMQLRNTAMFNSLAKELVTHPEEAKPQELSTTLWAYAKNRFANPMLFEAFGRAALENGKIRRFKLQELSNTAWSFATAGLHNEELFFHIEDAVLQKKSEMEPQSIANIMWAFAKLQVPVRTNLFLTLLKTTIAKQEQFKPQELSAVIWAASQMCPNSSSFFGAAMRICSHRLTEFSANAVANLVKTFSHVQTDDPEIFLTILQGALASLHELKPQGLCSVSYGATTAARAPAYSAQADKIGDAVSQICQHIVSRIHDFKSFELQHVTGMLHDNHTSLNSANVEALEHAVRDLVQSRNSQFDEESICSRRGSEEDDPMWPISHTPSRQGTGGTSTGDSGHARSALPPNNQRETKIKVQPEKLDLASVLPNFGRPIGDTLASLAQGSSNSGPMHPRPSSHFLGPSAPDEMPWKVPLPSTGSYKPGLIGSPAYPGYQTESDRLDSEGMIAASLHAMLAATLSGNTLAKHAQWSLPPPMSVQPTPHGL